MAFFGVVQKSSAAQFDDLGLRFRMATVEEFAKGVPLLHSKAIDPRPRGDHRDLYKFNASLRQVLQQIQQQEGSVAVDCNLFVQIAAIMLKHQQDHEGFILIAPEHTTILRVTNLLGEGFIYVHPADPGARHFLQMTSFASKGQWIYKVDKDNYVGLTEAGPKITSAIEWVHYTKRSLIAELEARREQMRSIKDFRDCAHLLDNKEEMEWSVLEEFYRIGALERWVLGPNF
jgi:hypothetical protein